jgi:pimeloyl-ACP methyl ester carboxylesterase
VKAPTLLIVGGRDVEVISLNRLALRKLPGTSSLEIIPGATHLFPEPGTLEEVIRLASEWFGTHLTRQGATWQPSAGW